MKKMKKDDAHRLFRNLRGGVRKAVRVSGAALKEQWFDMLRLFGLVEKKDGAPDETHTLFMRLSMKGWTDPDAVCLSTHRKAFTIGNAPQFDVYLDPSVVSVGELYCAVFFDKGINSYVFMLVSGGFSVPVKETDEPYLPGDWSLFTSGNREQTDLHNAIRVPVSAPDRIEHVRFNIANAYYFEAWACETDACAEPFAAEETAAPAEETAPVSEVLIPPAVPTEDIFEEEPSVVQEEPPAAHSDPVAEQEEPPTVHSDPVAVQEEPPAAHSDPVAVQEEPPAVHSDPVSVQNEPPAVSWIDAVSYIDDAPAVAPNVAPAPALEKKKAEPMSEEALRMAINAKLGQQQSNPDSSDNTQGDDSGCN